MESKRDWGFSGDYVKAMWLMLQQERPDTYVIGTEKTHSVREFCDVAFKYVGLNYKDYVKKDMQFYRPAEVDLLIADASKAHKVLGWKPKVQFNELVEMMVEADLKRVKEEK